MSSRGEAVGRRQVSGELEMFICLVAESFVMLYSVMAIEQTSESADRRVGEMISNRLLVGDRLMTTSSVYAPTTACSLD